MYDKQNPKQQNGLIYGYKLRYIGALQGILGSSYSQTSGIETFTQAELEQIERICQNAKSRAKTVFEETRDRLDRTESSSGTETEHRQYNGK